MCYLFYNIGKMFPRASAAKPSSGTHQLMMHLTLLFAMIAVDSCLCVRSHQSDQGELSNEQLAELDTEIEREQSELQELEAACRSKESVLHSLSTALTTEDAQKELDRVTKEVCGLLNWLCYFFSFTLLFLGG